MISGTKGRGRYFRAMLSFESLLAFALTLPAGDSRTLALELLRQGRVWRVRSWGPPKGGKTTALTMAAGVWGAPIRVLSVDRDIVERPGVEIILLPGFKSVGEMPVFHKVFMAAIAQAAKDLRAGKICGLVLDTISTLYSRFDTIAGANDAAFGMAVTQMKRNQARAAQAQAMAAIVGTVFGLHDDAIASPLDCPILLGVTEHARAVSMDPDKFDFSHKCWVPRIGGNTGEALFAQVDMQIALSIDKAPDDPRSYLARVEGVAGVGVRMLEPERLAFMRAMHNTKDTARFGVGLASVWNMRKEAWAKQYGFAG